MSLFDIFFLGMMIPTFLIAVVYILSRFTKDMCKEYKKDKKALTAFRNSFKLNPSNKAMAVRNK